MLWFKSGGNGGEIWSGHGVGGWRGEIERQVNVLSVRLEIHLGCGDGEIIRPDRPDRTEVPRVADGLAGRSNRGASLRAPLRENNAASSFFSIGFRRAGCNCLADCKPIGLRSSQIVGW